MNCMNYVGMIIEESLENKQVLSHVKILDTKVEPVTDEHKTPWVNQWTLHTIEIEENKVDEISSIISKGLDSEHDWYVDYRNNKFHYVVYRDKIFKIDRSKSYLYDEIKKYGLSKGIPEYQLDFSYHIEEWKRNNS